MPSGGAFAFYPPSGETDGLLTLHSTASNEVCTLEISDVIVHIETPDAWFETIPIPCEGDAFSLIIHGTAGSVAHVMGAGLDFFATISGAPGTIGTAAIPVSGITSATSYCIFSVENSCSGCINYSPGSTTILGSCVTVTPIPYPIVHLSAYSNPFCDGDPVTLYVASYPPSAGYVWTGPYFSGGATALSTIPSVLIGHAHAADVGLYSVTTDNLQCNSTDYMMLDMFPPAWAFISGCPDKVCPGDVANFTITGPEGSSVTYWDGIAGHAPITVTLPYYGCSTCSTSVVVTTPPIMGTTIYALTGVTSYDCPGTVVPLSSTCTINTYVQPILSVTFINGPPNLWVFACPGATPLCPITINYRTRRNFGGVLGPWNSGTYILSSTTTFVPWSYTALADNEIEIRSITLDPACGGCTWFVSIWLNENSGGKNNPGFDNNNGNSTFAESIQVTPNPTRGDISIDGMIGVVPSTMELTLDIIDVLGQVVYSKSVAADNGRISTKIELADRLANGIYILKIKGAGKDHNTRFVLSR